MDKFLRIVFFGLALIVLASCQSPTLKTGENTIKLKLSIPISGNSGSAQGRFLANISNQSVWIHIEADDILPIDDYAYSYDNGATYTADISVPIGTARTITASALDAGDSVYAQASVTTDIDIGMDPVDLTLIPNTSNPHYTASFSISGLMTYPDEAYVYAVDAGAGKSISVFYSTGISNADVYVTDSQGTVLFSASNPTYMNTFNNSSNPNPLATTYYVLLVGNGGSGTTNNFNVSVAP